MSIKNGWRFVLGIALSLLLVGCQHQESDYQYFLLHPNKLLAAYKRCNVLPPAAMAINPRCPAALQAWPRLSAMLIEGAMHGQRFGAKFLAAQAEMVNLNSRLTQAKKALRALQNQTDVQADQLAAKQATVDGLEKSVAALQFKVQSMRVVIRTLRPGQ